MKYLLSIVVVVLVPFTASAQPPTAASDDSMAQRVQQLEEEVGRLREQVNALLEAQTAHAADEAAPPRAPADDGSLENVDVIENAPASPAPDHHAATAASPGAAAPRTGNVFNPDIGIIGNLTGAVGQTASSPTIAATPSFALQESEASFQAIVDPYARADFFLAYGEEGVEVEEGYATFTALPAGFLLKAGKMRATFGRLNAFHNHTLPWVDRPVVMFNLLGGSTEDPDTGIKDSGLSVSRLFPVGKLFVETTGEVFRGDSGTLFQAAKRSDVSVIGHLRSYLDIDEASNFEGGVSYARGKNELGSDFTTQLYGVDLTYRWRPPARSIYRSFAARSELIWSRRQDPAGDQRAFGLYGSAEYQFARRWSGGLRYDWSERAAEAEMVDRGASAILTFRPTEFSSLRWQYRRSEFAEQRAANELLFQLIFVIGAHGAHPF